MTDQFREHGAISWFELTAMDLPAAEAFYTRLFGWTTEPWSGDPRYNMIKVNGAEIGGMMASCAANGSKPAGWGVYVTVTDVEETARKVPELGGKVLVEPTDIPRVGRFCVLQDPQGAVITAITYCRG